LTFLFIFTSSLITDAIGIHAIFGGYLVGLIMPNGHPFTLQVSSKVQDLVSIILLPLYFTLSGLKTNFNGLNSWKDLGLFLLILCCAIVGKLGGCGITSLCLGMNKKESFIVGILMNTRGLVEIIILNIGLEANIISEKLFTLFVSMAICTTLLTSPCVTLFYPTIEQTFVADDVSYYDRKTGSIEHTLSTKVLRELSDIGILMVVNSSEDVPALASLLYILKPQDGKEFVIVCSLTDSCMTTTDIIQATTSIQKLTIPLQMLQGIAMTINNVEMLFYNISCNSKHFAGNLIRKSLESDIDIIIIPFSTNSHYIKNMLALQGNTIVILLSGMITHEIICEKDFMDVLVIITGNSNDIGMLNFIDKWKRWISCKTGFMNICFHFILLVPIEKLSKILVDKLEDFNQYGIHMESGDYHSILNQISKNHYHFIVTAFSTINNDSPILGDVGSFLFSQKISPSILVVHDPQCKSSPSLHEEENGFVQITI
jgi:hypothetical protein